MTTYAKGALGVQFAGTSFTPTLGVGDASLPATSGSVYKNGFGQRDIFFNRMLRQNTNVKHRGLLNALIGTAPGGATANESWIVIVGQPLFGFFTTGVQLIGNQNRINRPTNVNDQTNFTVMFNGGRAPTPYIEDASGNGGGGKLGV